MVINIYVCIYVCVIVVYVGILVILGMVGTLRQGCQGCQYT